MEALKNFFRFLFGLVFHNLLTKLLCLLMAFVLYVYVNTSENIDRDFDVPLSIANRPPDLILTGQSHSEVHVTVNGPKAKMDQVKLDDLSLTLALPDGQKPGELGFRLDPDMVTTPPGIRVRTIAPATVTLRLEPLEQRTLEVRPSLEGTPREGYELAEVKVSPPQLEVTGPPSALEAMTSLETEIVDIEGMSGSFKQRVGLRPPNLVTPSVRRTVIVAVTIREKLLERTLEGIEVRAASGRPDVRIAPPAVALALKGPYSLVQILTPAQLELQVADEGLAPGQSARLPVRLRSGPPPRVEVLIEPEEVEVSAPAPAAAPTSTPEPEPAPRERPRPARRTPAPGKEKESP